MAFCSPVIFSDLAKVARSCIHALGDDSWPLWGLGNPGWTRKSNEADVIRVVPYLTYASEGSQVWLRPCHRDLCMVDQQDWWSPLGQVDKCILCFFKGISRLMKLAWNKSYWLNLYWQMPFSCGLHGARNFINTENMGLNSWINILRSRSSS